MRNWAILLAACLANPVATAERPSVGTAVFDSDPSNLWNRTYGCLLVRERADGTYYGADALDPLLWARTRDLLTGESHRNALTCLDEFLRRHGERVVQDPLKRALLQRDLWAVFDWAAAGDNLPQERKELEVRLAEAIRRVALTREEIAALPDTYAIAVRDGQFAVAYDPSNPSRPFLPAELFQEGAQWVCISAFSKQPTAKIHFSGRSRFLVFMRLPGGREATLNYVRKLRFWPEPALIQSGPETLLNLTLPQFPAGTQVALVRQATLIDTEGKLIPTKLTEQVQLRVYRVITPGASPYINYINGPSSHDQAFFEFRLSRRELFAHHNGGLFAVRPGDSEYPTFSTQGRDPFESGDELSDEGVILQRCRACHSDSGIHSVQSRTQWLHGWSDRSEEPNDEENDKALAWETKVTITLKEQQANFRLLQRLWQAGLTLR